MSTTAAFNRALDAYLQPPESEPERCVCRCGADDHNSDGSCSGCGDCDGFEPYDAYQAAEDHGYELADQAWKERVR